MKGWRNVRWGQVESDSISFMVHASHAGAEFPDDFDKQVPSSTLCVLRSGLSSMPPFLLG